MSGPGAARDATLRALSLIRAGELRAAAHLLRSLPAGASDGFTALQLGNALRYLGEAEEAAAHLEVALERGRAARDGTLGMAALCALGELELELGEPAGAAVRFGQALGITELTRDEAATVAPLAGLAESHARWRNPRKGAELARRALPRAVAAADLAGQARARTALAVALRDPAEALLAAAVAALVPHRPLELTARVVALELGADRADALAVRGAAAEMGARGLLERVARLG